MSDTKSPSDSLTSPNNDSSATTTNGADFDDFLMRRLQQEEEDELENLLNDDDDQAILDRYQNNNNSPNDPDQQDNTKQQEQQSHLEKQKSPSSLENQSSPDSSLSRKRSQSVASTQDENRIVLQWNQDDDKIDQSDEIFKSFHTKLLGVLRYNGTSLSDALEKDTSVLTNLASSAKEKLSTAVKRVSNNADAAAKENSSTTSTLSKENEDMSNIVETRLSLFISNLLNKFGKVITIPNPDDLHNRQENALQSTPEFRTLKQSLQRKLILLECTVDNMADTLSDCVRKNVRLGKQRSMLKQNTKDLKIQFLEQQKQIQSKDQEIRYLHEKISKLNQLAMKYKERLENHEQVEDQEEDLMLLASTEPQATAGARLMNSVMTWIGKKDGQQTDGDKQTNSTAGKQEHTDGTEGKQTSSWGSWFSKKKQGP